MASKGFTLVELLIVVIILGILAAVAVPQFTESAKDAREAVAMQNMEALADAIWRYRLEHGTWPGTPFGEENATEAGLIAHLTQYSDAAGKTSDTKDTSAWPFGPYLRSVPANPLRNTNGVRIVVIPAQATAAVLPGMKKADIVAVAADAFTNTYGWLYNPYTGEIIPNNESILLKLKR